MKTEAQELLKHNEDRNSKREVAEGLGSLVDLLDSVSQEMENQFAKLDDVAKDSKNNLSQTEVKAIKAKIDGIQKAVWKAREEAENLSEYFEFNIL